MQLTITQEKKSPLLHRRELIVEINHPGVMTPKNADVKKALADHYKVGEDVVALHKIMDNYGTTTCVVSATVYDNAEAFKKFAVIAKKPKKKEEAAAPAKTKGKK